ncbi:ABC transporter ATP-binding protein [Caballeronia sp. ATUFL_M1_KS5A]|uniref:ABC transporter ATP-binding protein n=1 Tax=Caballeronia sp. ATUFL_M1_KS5A TaxID=2921778 RepID=UPI0020292755|nr:ABC transporter ATP-binding protein [Caballeronia sp. ATUFL_M1_KS5A]
MGSPSLRTRNLGVSFGGHHAVRNVTTHFLSGTLTAIVGPNGAGKTTFFNLVSGQIRSTAGEVFVGDENVSRDPAAVRARKGIGRAFQLTNLFPRLTVRENVRLAVQATSDGRHRHPVSKFLSVWSDHRALAERADQLLTTTGLARVSERAASSLAHGDQRKLEVALLLALESRVLMFDEPTAGMSASESPEVLDLIKQIKRDPAKTIILVEHKMDVVRELADRVLVMHDGELIGDGNPTDVMALPTVQSAYLGNHGKELQ